MFICGNSPIGVRDDIALIEQDGRSPDTVQREVQSAMATMAVLEASEGDCSNPVR